MSNQLYAAFLSSKDTLRVYAEGELVFASGKKGLLALLDYINRTGAGGRSIVIMDRVVGNAAALLAVKAGCRDVWSPQGSELAVATLDKYGVRHHLGVIISYIHKDNSEEMCPMERLSLGKNPDEFLLALAAIVSK